MINSSVGDGKFAFSNLSFISSSSDPRRGFFIWCDFICQPIFAFFASYLFGFAYIKIIGGLLLIWIVNDLRKDLLEIKKVKSPTKKSKEPSYIQSVFKVLFADITISFDNVIGVVGAAKGYFGYMIFGLVLSVVLTGALATYMANYIQKHIWIAYVGLIFILIVGLQLVIGGLVDLEILKINEEFKKYF